MEPFAEIGAYYDLLYAEKDYEAEVRYVDSLIRQFGGSTGTMLDLGCGTGRHALAFAALGHKVHGVDRSDAMLEEAARRAKQVETMTFGKGDVCSCRLGRTFDAVVSLFHVYSYQTTNDRLIAAFRTAAEHLRLGGVFVFDFWYGPSVLVDQPQVRVKKLAADGMTMTRIATPTMHFDANTVTVDYDMIAIQEGQLREFRESHEMRYLFLPEVALMLDHVGLKPLGFREWLRDVEPTPADWNAVCVATK